MASLTMTTETYWDVPYIFKGATIIHDTYSWADGQRLAELFNEKLLSFRLGKRQSSLFGSLLLRYSMRFNSLIDNIVVLSL